MVRYTGELPRAYTIRELREVSTGELPIQDEKGEVYRRCYQSKIRYG